MGIWGKRRLWWSEESEEWVLGAVPVRSPDGVENCRSVIN